MIKTQVYLTENDYEELRNTAFETRLTMSEVVRRLIRRELPTKATMPKKKPKNAGETLLALAQKARKEGWSGPKDLATNVDHYLYGTPKKK